MTLCRLGAAVTEGRSRVGVRRRTRGFCLLVDCAEFGTGQVLEDSSGLCVQAAKRLFSSTCFLVPLNSKAVPLTVLVELPV